MQKKYKPFFKWSGGKSREWDKVVSHMPSEYGTFYEPFLGGGAIWLGLAKSPSVVGDFYDEVTNFFQVLKDEGQNFIDECNEISRDYNLKFKNNVVGKYDSEVKDAVATLSDYVDEQNTVFFADFDKMLLPLLNTTPKAQREYDKLKKKKIKDVMKSDKKHIALKKKLKDTRAKGKSEYSENSDIFYGWRNQHNLEGIEKAKRFFVLRCLAYGGMLRFNAKGEFNVPYGFYKSFKSLSYPEGIGELLQNTTILNDTWQKTVSTAGPDDFVFLDPPYTREFTEYSSGNDFGKQDHIDLANYFRNSKSKCMIIINKDDFTSELYKGFIKEEYDFTYSVKYRDRLSVSDASTMHFVATNY
jgi:DNA adenine methylase